MKSHLIFALEDEPLNIVALHDAEKASNKSNEFDDEYQSVKDKIETKSEEGSEDPSSVDASDTDSSVDEDTEIEETSDHEVESSEKETEDETDDKEPSDESEPKEEEEPVEKADKVDTEVEDDPEEVKEAKESFRELKYISENSLALEGEYLDKTKDVLQAAAGHTYDALKYLALVGIKWTPVIAKHVYKGVVFVMGKLFKLLFKGIKDLTVYTKRRINSFENLKKEIKTIKESLNNKTEFNQDIESLVFSDSKTIDKLKIGSSIDLDKNILTLSNYVNVIVKYLDTEILRDVNSIKHLIAMSSSGHGSATLDIMKINVSSSVLKSGVIKGYVSNKDHIENYVSSVVLPGDVRLVAHLPKDSANSLEDVTLAYNDSSIFFGIDMLNYKTVDGVHYMKTEALIRLLNELDKLCDVCISHKTMYESIIKSKLGLRYNFKNYFNKLVESNEKVTLHNSLLELVYLKSMFIDKVYITAAMDVHDFSVKVIHSNLTFIKKNISKL